MPNEVGIEKAKSPKSIKTAFHALTEYQKFADISKKWNCTISISFLWCTNSIYFWSLYMEMMSMSQKKIHLYWVQIFHIFTSLVMSKTCFLFFRNPWKTPCRALCTLSCSTNTHWARMKPLFIIHDIFEREQVLRKLS